jgi:hypothetical protein
MQTQNYSSEVTGFSCLLRLSDLQEDDLNPALRQFLLLNDLTHRMTSQDDLLVPSPCIGRRPQVHSLSLKNDLDSGINPADVTDLLHPSLILLTFRICAVLSSSDLAESILI